MRLDFGFQTIEYCIIILKTILEKNGNYNRKCDFAKKLNCSDTNNSFRIIFEALEEENGLSSERIGRDEFISIDDKILRALIYNQNKMKEFKYFFKVEA